MFCEKSEALAWSFIGWRRKIDDVLERKATLVIEISTVRGCHKQKVLGLNFLSVYSKM